MSEPAEEWLTVSQAAARLGISEKTLLRRIRRGELEAHKEPLPNGGSAWRVHLNTEQDAPEPEGTDKRAEEARAGTGQDTKDSEKDSAPVVSFARAGSGQDSGQDTLTAHLLEENRFLRGVVEQQQRDAAELRQALREALKLQTRALPSPAESAPSVAAGEETPTAPKVAQRGAAGRESGFWRRVRWVLQGKV